MKMFVHQIQELHSVQTNLANCYSYRVLLGIQLECKLIIYAIELN